jgi:hypothetical protein
MTYVDPTATLARLAATAERLQARQNLQDARDYLAHLNAPAEAREALAAGVAAVRAERVAAARADDRQAVAATNSLDVAAVALQQNRKTR